MKDCDMESVLLSKVDVAIGNENVTFGVGIHVSEILHNLQTLKLNSPLYYFDKEYNAMNKALLRILRLNNVRLDARINTFISNGYAERLAKAQRELKRVEEYYPSELVNTSLRMYAVPSESGWVGLSGCGDVLADARVLHWAQQAAVALTSLQLEVAAATFNKMMLPRIQFPC